MILREKLMAKIKFIDSDILHIGHIPLRAVISLTNKHQTADAFEALINQVITCYPSEIAQLEVILGTELYRHYLGIEGAQTLANDWLKTNQVYFEKLVENNIFYKISTWGDFTQTPEYFTNFRRVQDLYETDNFFFNLVGNLADEFSQKNNTQEKNAVAFLLEECAVFGLLTGYIAYPHKEINSAITYAISKIGKKFNYMGYTVDYRKDKSKIAMPETLPHQHPLYQHLLTIKECFEAHGIKGRDQQIRYYSAFCRAIEKRKNSA
jgi:hypothetical protein